MLLTAHDLQKSRAESRQELLDEACTVMGQGLFAKKLMEIVGTAGPIQPLTADSGAIQGLKDLQGQLMTANESINSLDSHMD